MVDPASPAPQPASARQVPPLASAPQVPPAPRVQPVTSAARLPLAPGVYRFRDAVSGLGRVLPLAYAAERHAGTDRDMARVRGASPAARAGLARTTAAVLNRDPAVVTSLRAELTARRDAAAAALAFEFAGRLQAELEAVDWITGEQKVTQAQPCDVDVYGWAGGVLVCFEIRGGRMSGWRQRACGAAAARSRLARTPPAWADFARRAAELAAHL